MTAATALPTAATLEILLDQLYGRDVRVTAGSRPAAGSQVIAIDYVNHLGRVRISLVADLRAVSSLGAALTMIPPAHAQAAHESGDMSPSMLENFSEVCNVISGLVSRTDDLFLSAPAAAPEAFGASPHGLTDRVVLSVAVAGYDEGTIVFRA